MTRCAIDDGTVVRDLVSIYLGRDVSFRWRGGAIGSGRYAAIAAIHRLVGASVTFRSGVVGDGRFGIA